MRETGPVPSGVVIAAGQIGHRANPTQLGNDITGRLQVGHARQDTEFFSERKPRNLTYGKPNKIRHNGGMEQRDTADIRARLERLRAVFEIGSQSEMARRLGVSDDAYHVAERQGRLGLAIALAICQKFPGVTMDWLFHGNPAGMPFDLLKRISELPGASDRPLLMRNRAKRQNGAGFPLGSGKILLHQLFQTIHDLQGLVAVSRKLDGKLHRYTVWHRVAPISGLVAHLIGT